MCLLTFSASCTSFPASRPPMSFTFGLCILNLERGCHSLIISLLSVYRFLYGFRHCTVHYTHHGRYRYLHIPFNHHVSWVLLLSPVLRLRVNILNRRYLASQPFRFLIACTLKLCTSLLLCRSCWPVLTTRAPPDISSSHVLLRLIYSWPNDSAATTVHESALTQLPPTPPTCPIIFPPAHNQLEFLMHACRWYL